MKIELVGGPLDGRRLVTAYDVLEYRAPYMPSFSAKTIQTPFGERPNYGEIVYKLRTLCTSEEFYKFDYVGVEK